MPPDSPSSTDGARRERENAQIIMREKLRIMAAYERSQADLHTARERTRVLEEALRKDRDWWTMADAESIAERFHEEYERLAPEFGYRTREESAVPWEQVPHRNRLLMIETVRAVTASLAAVAVEDEGYMPTEDEQAHAADKGAASVERAREAAGTSAAEPPHDPEEDNDG